MFRFAFVALLASPLLLPAAQLTTNGDFGTGDTSGWTVTNGGVGLGGQAEVGPAFGSQTPQSENNVALIHTGPAALFGSSFPSSISLSQTFTVASASLVDISFIYTPLTARFTGSSALVNEIDSFLVRLIPSAGANIDLLNFDVTSTSFLPVPDNGGGPLSSPNGANFFEYIPATAYSNSVALASGSYTLEFFVANDGDSLFDSGMLIEGVSVTDSVTGTVPEPSTLLMLGSAIAAIAGFRMRRRATVSKN